MEAQLNEVARDMFYELAVVRRGTRLDREIASREFNSGLWVLYRLALLTEGEWDWWQMSIFDETYGSCGCAKHVVAERK